MQAPAPKRAVRAAFDKAADNYDAVASVQRAACDRLLQLAVRNDHQPARILDAGCGTGYAPATVSAAASSTSRSLPSRGWNSSNKGSTVPTRP